MLKSNKIRFPKFLKIRDNTLDDYIFNEIYSQKVYARLNLQKSDAILDAGAHIGIFACWASPQVNSILSIEPEKENFALLTENVRRMNCSNVAVMNSALVGNSDKIRTLYRSVKRENVKHNTGAHSFLSKRGRKGTEVNCININDVLKNSRINKIKLDVEGAEVEVVNAIKDWSRIDAIIMEFHISMLNDYQNTAYDQLTTILKQHFNIVHHENGRKKCRTTIIYAQK